MIRYLRNTEIKKNQWDICISSSLNGLVYADSWYLDIVSPGWDALVEDDYVSVFPLTYRKKAGINYLFQPYFTQQLGLFSIEQNYSENKLSDFLSALPKKFRFIEIQLNTSNNLMSSVGFSLHPKLTHHLNLSNSFEITSGNYSENLRRNIKKSEKSSVKISGNVLPHDIINLFRQNRGVEISNLKSSDYDTLSSLLASADERKLMDSRGILNSSGKLTAGAIFLTSPKSYIFLFSAADKEAKETGAMSALIDSFIKDHSRENRYLDFEGSMDVNLARFYKSFGSQEIVYLQIRRNNLPFVIRWLKQI